MLTTTFYILGGGPDALQPKKKARPTEMPKDKILPRKKDPSSEESPSCSQAESPDGLRILEGLEEIIEKTRDCPYRRILHSDQDWYNQDRMKES